MNAPLKAAAWMTGTIASLSAMAIAGREASLVLDTFEIMLYRSAVGVLIMIFVISLLGKWREIRTQRPGLHLIRNIVHFTGQNLWFYAVTVIPLAQVFALEFASPLWVILLSPLLLGETLTRIRALAAVIGFAGILIVARPDPMALNLGVIAAASSAVFFALSILTTKKLTQTDSITCILFFLTLIQLGLGLITAGYDGDLALPDAQTLPWLLLISCAGLSTHFCLTRALQLAPASTVAPIDFVRLPVIAVLGMALYGEALDLWVFVGALIIFAGNYLNIWAETQKRHK